MSGPKCSRYEIEAAERRRLEAERLRRLEEERRLLEEERRRQEALRRQCLEQSIAVALSGLDEMRTAIFAEASDKMQQAHETMGDSHHIDTLDRSMADLLRSVAAFPRSFDHRDISGMEQYLDRITKFQESLDRYLNGTFRAAVAALDSATREFRYSSSEKEFLSVSHDVKRKNISLQAQEFMSKAPDQGSASMLQNALDQLRSLVQPYVGNRFLCNGKDLGELVEAAERITSHENLDDDYKLSQIKMRSKAFLRSKESYDEEIALSRQNLSEYEHLDTTYRALCNMLGEEPQEHEFIVSQANRLIEDLREVVQQKQETLVRKDETEFIAHNIDEVLAELGYEVMETEFMVTPKRNIIHDIYAFERDNVINVFTSDNGSLMLEVTGVKDGAKELTTHEKLNITESMESFCSLYPEIKRRLKTRGIQLSSEDLKPPDITYARAINLSRNSATSGLRGRKRRVKGNTNERAL